MNIHQKHIGIGALQSFGSTVCIFSFFEHFRALPEHLRKHWENVQESIFWINFLYAVLLHCAVDAREVLVDARGVLVDARKLQKCKI